MENELKIFIDKVDNYLSKIKWSELDNEKQILYRSMKLTEEIGEFNEEILSFLGKSRSDKLDKFNKKNLENEFADVIFSVYLVAKSCDININKALENKMKILEKRFGF